MASDSQRFLSIRVEGPESFARALGKANRDIKRTFSAAVRGVAAQVRDAARARYRGRYIQRSGKSVKGITSRESFGTGRVRLGKSRPWLLGQEWGGYATRFHPHNLPQIRGGTSGVGGTFLWPAVTESRDKVTEAVEESIEDAVRTLKGRRGG